MFLTTVMAYALVGVTCAGLILLYGAIERSIKFFQRTIETNRKVLEEGYVKQIQFDFYKTYREKEKRTLQERIEQLEKSSTKKR